MLKNITEKEIAAIVREGVGMTPIGFEFIDEPNINMICEVETKDEERLMVRVNKDPNRVSVLEFQAGLMDRVRGQGVPVPDVLHFGNTTIEAAYLIYRKIEGITGDTFEGNTTPVWYQLGEYAHKINAIKGDKYGKVSFWSGRGTELYETWNDFVYARVQSLGTAREELFARGADENFVNRVLEEIQIMRDWDVEARLVHGDLALKNVVLDGEGRIEGIIDWDEALYARAPHFDLPPVTLFNYPTERFAFAEGYGLSPKEWEELMHEMRPVFLLLLLDHMVWFVHSDQPESFKEVYWRMHELLGQ